MDQPNPPAAVWIDRDPQMEAVAAAIWDQCLTEGSILVDDPRNIAAVAVAAIRTAAGAQQAEPEEQPACGQCGDTGACNGGPCPLLERRGRFAAGLWTAAEHNIIAEWICCDPLDPKHDLCTQGYATLDMIRALIVDDPESHRTAPLTDAVMAMAAEELANLQRLAELKWGLQRKEVRRLRAELEQARGTTGQDTTTPPAEGEQEIRQQIAAALHNRGAYCGECNFEDDSATCSDCARIRGWYVDAVLPVMRAAVAARGDEILRIVSDVTIEANDFGGVDINDLVTRLAAAGYPLPDDEGDDAA